MGEPAQADPERIRTARERLETWGPQNFRNRGAHHLAEDLQLLFGYTASLERRAQEAEATVRSVKADLTAAHARLESWRAYAQRCADRLSVTRLRMEMLLKRIDAFRVVPTWIFRRRRTAWRDVATQLVHCEHDLLQPVPGRPEEDPA